jgi:hypothetical protein
MNIASHFRSLRCTSQAAFEAQELPGELETQQACLTRPMNQQKLWDEATEMGRSWDFF